jgi:hypothetical protein
MWEHVECEQGQKALELFQFKCLCGSSLVNMYAKFGSMEDAWRVFNKNLYEQ